jgi:hypothetical protein
MIISYYIMKMRSARACCSTGLPWEHDYGGPVSATTKLMLHDIIPTEVKCVCGVGRGKVIEVMCIVVLYSC